MGSPFERNPTREFAVADAVVRRTMGLTRDEFLRTLPSVLDGEPYIDRDGIILVGKPPGKSIEIVLQSAPAVCLGALRLPSLDVEIVFRGYGPEERERFLERFRRRFQRGGG